jgi:hypothetical protein
MLNKLLNLRNNLCFKKIFGSRANEDLLIQFLNDSFDRKQLHKLGVDMQWIQAEAELKEALRAC